MPPPTGSVEALKRTDGSVYYRARIRIQGRKQIRIDIPPEYATDESRREFALAMFQREEKHGTLAASLFVHKAKRITSISLTHGADLFAALATWSAQPTAAHAKDVCVELRRLVDAETRLTKGAPF